MKILSIIVISIILVTLGSSQFIQGASNNPTNSILKISFDKSEYSSGDKVKIILEYLEFNNPQKLDIFGQTSTETVNIQTNRGTLNHIQFTETGINTGIFTKEITLGGPKGFISYSNTGTSLPNGDTDMLIVTVQDQMNSRSASKMVPINPIQSRVNSNQVLSENSENSNDVDCTPLSIDVPNRIIENLSVYVKNPNVDNCEYVFSLHDTEFLKIKTLGNVFFSKTLLIDRNTVNGDYYILVMSTDNQYSKFFPVTIDLPPFIDIPLDVEIPDNIENIFSDETTFGLALLIFVAFVIPVILTVIIYLLKSRNKDRKNEFSDTEKITYINGVRIDEQENGPNRYDKVGYDKNGYDKNGYDKNGYDKNGYDYTGFNKQGFNREGFNREGWNKQGFNKQGFNREGYDVNGYDKDGYSKHGFDKNEIHRNTGTKFNLEGYDVNGFHKDGYSKHGFDKNGIHKDTGTKFNLEGYDVNGYDKEGLDYSGLLAKLDNFELQITPFKGEQKFAIIRSGGNFDFYDSDFPAYILQVRLNGADEKMQTRLTQSIRNAHHVKPIVFTSKSSIGAYWQTDLIEEEIAKSILLKIIRNYNQFYT